MPKQRWVVLVAGLLAVATGCTVQYGVSFLIPALRAGGLDLAQAGTVAGAPIAGLLATLYAWGAAADRWGERLVMTFGLSLGGIALLAWAIPASPAPTEGIRVVPLGACLVLAGAGTAAVHAASGRLVLGWFAAHERGRAMAVRQSAQPIGVAVAALALPALGERGLPVAVPVLGVGCLAGAALTAALVRNPPPRTAAATGTEAGSPYRGSTLWRIHAASSLLVIPQFVTITYALVYLVDVQSWSSVPAGGLLAAAQFAGAANRLLVGWWSDRAGSRLRPMRRLALGVAAVLAVLALGTLSGSPALAVGALVAAAVLSSSTNGLAFTAVAEHAGGAWAGRALGVQNTAQNAFAAATPAAFGLVIAAAGYAGAFGLAATLPVLACALVPVSGEARAVRPPASPAAPSRPAGP